MDIQACLPSELRGATITPITQGLSGAGVYRVEAGDRAYVLKVGIDRPAIQRAAAAAGLAPRIVHVDDERRAIVSDFIADRGFAAFYMTAREPALELLGRTLRRVHELPVEGTPADPRGFLATLTGRIEGFAVPSFARDFMARMRDEEPPPADRPLVQSHNDVNPANLVYDGERLLLLDWDVAGPNDPCYDPATIALFMRMDDDACRRLLSEPALPPRFRYFRRLVGAMCGGIMLDFARAAGHAGGASAEALPLLDVYMKIRAGTVSPATPEGKWIFGLALIRAAASATP
jgi:aminoglycoside phosphotransferase